MQDDLKLNEITPDTAAKLVELPTDPAEALEQILTTSHTLVLGSPRQSRNLVHALVDFIVHQKPLVPYCLIDLTNHDEFERLTVDVSEVGGEMDIQPGILARTLESENGVLLIYNAQENSEGINDIFDGSFWQLNKTLLRIAKSLTIVGIVPIASKQALKSHKISLAQSGRYQRTCVLSESIDFKQSISIPDAKSMPSSHNKDEFTLDCGFKKVESLEAYLLGTFPREQKTGQPHFVPGKLIKELQQSSSQIVFILRNVLQSDIVVDCFVKKLAQSTLGEPLQVNRQSLDLGKAAFYIDTSSPQIRKKIISIKPEACRGLTNIISITAYTVGSIFRSTLRAQAQEDKSSFLYEDPTGILHRIENPEEINWVISGNLIAEDFYSTLELPNLYILDNVVVPPELKSYVDRQSGTIQDAKTETTQKKPWVKVLICEDQHRQAVLDQLILDNDQAKIIYTAEHDIRLVTPLWQALQQKQQVVILTDLAKNPELLESLQNFFNGAVGYRDLSGQWLLPADSGGTVILLASREEYIKQVWLQELAYQEFQPLPQSTIPETQPSLEGSKNFTLLSAMLKHEKRFIFCLGANSWQQTDTITRLEDEAKVWTYKLGKSTGFADFEDLFMQWAENQETTAQKIFVFTGEMSSPALLFLQGLSRSAEIVLPNSETIPLSKNHIVIFFQDIGVKKPLALLENLATKITYTPLTFNEIEAQILQPLIKAEGLDIIDSQQTYNLTSLLRSLNNWLTRCKINLSIEDYMAIICRIAAHDFALCEIKEEEKMATTTPLIWKWVVAVRLIVLPYLKPDMQRAFKNWLSFMLPNQNIPLDQHEMATKSLFIIDNTIVDTPQTRHGLDTIFQYIQSYFYFSQKKQKMPGKTGLAVIGETMAGKSFLVFKAVSSVLSEIGYRLINGGPYTQLNHTPDQITICSELNLLAKEVLNQISDMPLIGTMNPPGKRYESRQKLPPTLIARMFQLNLETPLPAELLNIHKIPAEYHNQLLQFHHYAGIYASTRALINAGQWCQRQGRFDLSSCFQAYGYPLWDVDEFKAASSLASAPQAGLGKTFFYFFEGLGEKELFITFTSDEKEQTALVADERTILMPFPKADSTENNDFDLLGRLLFYSIAYWINSVTNTINFPMTYIFLLTSEIFNKYYPSFYSALFLSHNESLRKMYYEDNNFENRVAEWLEKIKYDAIEFRVLNSQDGKAVYLFMRLWQVLRNDEGIDWVKISQQFAITDYLLLANLLDISDLQDSDQVSIKDYIKTKKVPLIKSMAMSFDFSEAGKIQIPTPLIGSSEIIESGVLRAPKVPRTLAQITPPQVYYFPTNYLVLDDKTGLPIIRDRHYLTPSGVPDECSLPAELDERYQPGTPVTIELQYSELSHAKEMLLLMPVFHELYEELPSHLICHYKNGNHYVCKAQQHEGDEQASLPFSYKVVLYSMQTDFKSHSSVQFIPVLPIDESQLPPKIFSLLCELKRSTSSKAIHLALTNLRDGLKNYLKYITNQKRGSRFHLQAEHVDKEELMKMFYFCLRTRKVKCIEGFIIFLILVRCALGDKVSIHVLYGYMSDNQGKLTDEQHIFTMINGIIFDPTPAGILSFVPDIKDVYLEEKEQKLAPEMDMQGSDEKRIKRLPEDVSQKKLPKTESMPKSKPQTVSEHEIKVKSKTTNELSDKKLGKPILSTISQEQISRSEQKQASEEIKTNYELMWTKDRDVIILHLEPLFKILGGQSAQAGGVMHTHYPVSQSINHRRAAAGMSAYIKKNFPITFTPITLISLSFPMHDSEGLPIKDFSTQHFLLQCLLEKGFKLGVPSKQGIIESKDADDFIAETKKLNSASEKDIERFESSSDLPCKVMHRNDWAKIFKHFNEILQTVAKEKYQALPRGQRGLLDAKKHLEQDDVDYFESIGYGIKNTKILLKLAEQQYPNSKACLAYLRTRPERLEKEEQTHLLRSSVRIFKPPAAIIKFPKFIIVNQDVEVKTIINVLCLGRKDKEVDISRFMTNLMLRGVMTDSARLQTSSFEYPVDTKKFRISCCAAESLAAAKEAVLNQSIIFVFDEVSDYLPKGPKKMGYAPSIKQGRIYLDFVDNQYWDMATNSIVITEISAMAALHSDQLLIQSSQLISPLQQDHNQNQSQCLLQ